MSPFTDHPLAGTPPFLLASARKVGIAFLVLGLALVLAPWQQTSHGFGRVTPYSPDEREQRVDAPVGGRVARWFVVDGQRVDEGDPLVELVDVDPAYLERLEQARAALHQRLAAAEARVRALAEQVGADNDAGKDRVSGAQQQVRMAEQRIRAAEQRRAAARAALDTERAQLARLGELAAEGLVSQRDLELATLKVTEAEVAVNSAEATIKEARANQAGLRADASRAGSEANALVASSEAQRTAAQAEVASAQEALARMEVSLSRQRAQLVRAPRTGMVLSLNHQVTGGIVQEGERLALLVPSDATQAVELYIDGNDAPLIGEGRRVRLQFEGWPAIQFSGWPSVAVGTFGGRVLFIDAVAQADGSFRVVVVPDAAWPSNRLLRQGVQARGWILLDEVPLGFEVWRRVNGFPPGLRTANALFNDDDKERRP